MTIPNSSMLKFFVAAIISIQTFSIGQKQPEITFNKSEVIAGLKHPDWQERAKVLKSTPMTLLTDKEISEMLINLLSSENDSYWTIVRGPAEAWGEYYHLLVKKVGETGNDKAIPVLINSIYAGGSRPAAQALASFSDKGILALLDALDRPGDMEREIVLETITLMIAMQAIEDTGTILSSQTKERLQDTMIPLTTNYSQVPAVRKDAVKILGHLDNPRVIAHLEYLAASDPYYVDYFIPGKRGKRIKGHPVRKEAQIQLEKIRKSRPE